MVFKDTFDFINPKQRYLFMRRRSFRNRRASRRRSVRRLVRRSKFYGVPYRGSRL